MRSETGRPKRWPGRHLETADLEADDTLEGLYRTAIDTGVISPAEADRLAFVAAAERAIRLAGAGRIESPAAVFLATVRNLEDRRRYISQGDERAAHDRVRRIFQGVDR